MKKLALIFGIALIAIFTACGSSQSDKEKEAKANKEADSLLKLAEKMMMDTTATKDTSATAKKDDKKEEKKETKKEQKKG